MLNRNRWNEKLGEALNCSNVHRCLTIARYVSSMALVLARRKRSASPKASNARHIAATTVSVIHEVVFLPSCKHFGLRHPSVVSGFNRAVHCFWDDHAAQGCWGANADSLSRLGHCEADQGRHFGGRRSRRLWLKCLVEDVPR